MGNNVVKILSEMFNVEFYVTNKNNDYLLSFNHHDILSACGNAKEWLKQYNPSNKIKYVSMNCLKVGLL